MTFMVSYGILLRLYIHIIQWVEYYKNCHEIRLKGTDFQIVVFRVDLIGRKLWWIFCLIEFLYIYET